MIGLSVNVIGPGTILFKIALVKSVEVILQLINLALVKSLFVKDKP
jgi:hypothetical protein